MADERSPGSGGLAAARPIGDRAQIELLELLRSRDPRLGQTYEGALHAYADPGNPDHLAQAAHSMRELFDALPAAVGVERRKTADLGDKVTLVAAGWKKAIGRTTTVKAGWHGEIDSPLRKVLQALAEFEVAPAKTRAHAIEFLGRVLRNDEAQLSDAQAGRMRDLWQRRFDAFASEPDAHREEVGSFGWWFASKGKLPDAWLMAELLRVLERGAPIDDAHFVVERLSEVATAWPYEATRALRLMLPVQKEHYFLHGEETRRLIRTALISEDERARREARELLEELVARGYSSYADLAEEAHD